MQHIIAYDKIHVLAGDVNFTRSWVPAGNTRDRAGMKGGFSPADNRDGEFKNPFVKWGGAGIMISVPADVQCKITKLPLYH